MAFTYGKTKLGKVAYEVYVLCAGSTSFTSTYKRVGICSAEPSLKETKGDTIKTNDGIDNVIAKNDEVTFTILEVTKDNRTAMLELINKSSNVALVPKTASPAATLADPIIATGAWVMTGVNIFPETNITGNAQNQIVCSGMVEVAPDDATALVGI